MDNFKGEKLIQKTDIRILTPSQPRRLCQGEGGGGEREDGRSALVGSGNQI